MNPFLVIDPFSLSVSLLSSSISRQSFRESFSKIYSSRDGRLQDSKTPSDSRQLKSFTYSQSLLEMRFSCDLMTRTVFIDNKMENKNKSDQTKEFNRIVFALSGSIPGTVRNKIFYVSPM